MIVLLLASELGIMVFALEETVDLSQTVQSLFSLLQSAIRLVLETVTVSVLLVGT